MQVTLGLTSTPPAPGHDDDGQPGPAAARPPTSSTPPRLPPPPSLSSFFPMPRGPPPPPPASQHRLACACTHRLPVRDRAPPIQRRPLFPFPHAYATLSVAVNLCWLYVQYMRSWHGVGPGGVYLILLWTSYSSSTYIHSIVGGGASISVVIWPFTLRGLALRYASVWGRCISLVIVARSVPFL